MNLQQKLNEAAEQIHAQDLQKFKRLQGKRARLIADVLSNDLISELRIQLVAEDQDNSGNFFFELNNRRYSITTPLKSSYSNERHLFVSRDYYDKSLTCDEDLLEFLVVDKNRKVYDSGSPTQYAFPSGDNQSGGLTILDYFVGQAIAIGVFGSDAVEIAKEAVAILYPEPTPAIVRNYSFAEVLNWCQEFEESDPKVTSSV